MTRLYANEHFPHPAVIALRALGHDVMTTFEAGHASTAVPDREVLATATLAGRAVLTLKRRNFIRLHSQHLPSTPTHSGIIVCTLDPDFDRLARSSHTSLRAAGPLTGQLIRITRPQI